MLLSADEFVSDWEAALVRALLLAWVMEQAGAAALAALGMPLLGVPVRDLHQRTPLYVGSPGLVAGLGTVTAPQ